MYRRYVKRFLDIIISGLALIALSPILVVFTGLGVLGMGGNPFFVQERPGKDEKIFKLIKFRTMTYKKDVNGSVSPDDERVNAYGRFLRSTSIDELPELINIFKGDMSIVGPRPLLVEYLPYYTEEEKKRHDVRPGLTGLAQINGRNAISWKERFKLDNYYVDNISLSMDLKIIVSTIAKVIKRSDILVGRQIPAGRLDVARATTIRRFEKSDVPNKVRWINDEQNNKYLHYELPLREDKTMEWFENNRDRTDRYDAVIELSGKPVGIIGLLDIRNGEAEYYITVGEQYAKDKGVASHATLQLFDYAFNQLKLSRIKCYTEVENVSAQGLFEKCGFVRTGLIKNSAVNRGKAVDRYSYVITREGYKSNV